MNAIAELSWRAYPAAALLAAGALVALRGLYRGVVHDAEHRAARRLLDGLSGFRLAVIGCAPWVSASPGCGGSAGCSACR